MPGHDVYSKRNQSLPDVFVYDDLPSKLRYQIKFIWDKAIGTWEDTGTYYQHTTDTLQLIDRVLCEEHGVHSLTEHAKSREKDVVSALLHSQNLAYVLDAIELSFRAILAFDDYQLRTDQKKSFVELLNHRFRENGVGYEFDLNARQLIRIDSTLVHAEVIKPTLCLLADRRFKTANNEMLKAFDDYRKGDFGDCLTKCCSALESTIKIVCTKNGWTFDPHKDTAGTLIQKIIDKGGLPPFFKEPLTLIASMRNKLSTSHGAGTVPRNVPPNYARYALHSTASAILLIASVE